jgi:hypothetical protein
MTRLGDPLGTHVDLPGGYGAGAKRPTLIPVENVLAFALTMALLLQLVLVMREFRSTNARGD